MAVSLERRAQHRAVGEVTLDRVAAGTSVVIVELDNDADDDCRLRDYGVFEGTVVEVVSAGDPVVLSVFGNRLAICGRCARRVAVRPVDLA